MVLTQFPYGIYDDDISNEYIIKPFYSNTPDFHKKQSKLALEQDGVDSTLYHLIQGSKNKNKMKNS